MRQGLLQYPAIDKIVTGKSSQNMLGDGMREKAELSKTAGPWPFVTLRQYEEAGKVQVWYSRGHRKSLGPDFAGSAFLALHPRSLNPWIASGFGIGSLLFIAGSILSLWPALMQILVLSDAQVGAIYFGGSIFFTLAAYLQLFQAANTGLRLPGAEPPKSMIWLGWQIGNIGWLSSALQFVGTVLFNVNTFTSVGPVTDWFWQDVLIWLPDFLGSVLFLLSGYLAFIEVCNGYWAWQWRNPSWWVVWINLLGCIAFMVSAVYAFVPPGGAQESHVAAATVWTLIGAVGFLAGAYFMLVENRAAGTASADAH